MTATTVSTLEVLCRGFGITLSEFFAGDGEPVSLTAGQRDLLAQWGRLTTEQRQRLLDFLKAL